MVEDCGVDFKDLDNTQETPAIRTTKTKCCVTGIYNKEQLIFTKQKFGKVKIEWHGHIDIKTNRVERCNLHHEHIVYKKETFVWDYAIISRSEANLLADFLWGKT